MMNAKAIPFSFLFLVFAIPIAESPLKDLTLRMDNYSKVTAMIWVLPCGPVTTCIVEDTDLTNHLKTMSRDAEKTATCHEIVV